MLATFVIGLREGLECALIVGIVAAFLRRADQRRALVWMWVGVGAAVVLCFAAGIALSVLSRELPYKQQEALETVIAAVAVVMVTYMIAWMKNHSRDLKANLEAAAQGAIAQGSVWALIAMAFLAVLREGFETSVFLVAAFDASANATTAAAGALLGIAVSIGLGYGIYRGGVRLNLSKFFRATGVVLALVAAGLVVSALHTAHEAGWLDFGQQRVLDLRWLVQPGSVQSSLLTGVLGVQPQPTLIEAVGWVLYLVPVLTVVLWPPTRPVPWAGFQRGFAIAAAGCVAAAVVSLIAAPATPTMPETILPSRTATTVTDLGRALGVDRPAASTSDQVVLLTNDKVTIEAGGRTTTLSVRPTGVTREIGGSAVREYAGNAPAAADRDLPASTTLAQLSRSGDRLPIGLNEQTTSGEIPLAYTATDRVTLLVGEHDRVVASTLERRTFATATTDAGTKVSVGQVRAIQVTETEAARAAAADKVVAAEGRFDRHQQFAVVLPVLLGTAGLVFLLGATVAWRRTRAVPARTAAPSTRATTETKESVSR